MNVIANQTRARRGKNPESREAKSAGDKNRLREMALRSVRLCGKRGATADEIAAELQLGHNSVAPRLTELKAHGLLNELLDSRGHRVRRRTRQGCFAGVLTAGFSENSESSREITAAFAQNSEIVSEKTFPEFGPMTPGRRYPD